MAFIKKPFETTQAPEPEMSLDELIPKLQSADPATRKIAAQRLASHADAASALTAALGGEENPAIRAALLTALIKISNAEAAVGLITYLRSEDVGLRNDAIIALQQMPEAVLPHMETLLQDSDHDVRIFAINILAALRHARAPGLLLGVIGTDPHMNVCATAIDALAEIGTPDMVPAIRATALRFDSDYIRFATDVAISRIGG